MAWLRDKYIGMQDKAFALPFPSRTVGEARASVATSQDVVWVLHIVDVVADMTLMHCQGG